MIEWKECKLGDVADFINGRAFKATEFKDSGTPIVRIQNLTGIGNTVYSDLVLPEDKYISTGDLIYAWSATFGPYIWKGNKSIYHYHIWKINCHSIDKKYLFYHLLRTSDTLKESGNGTLFIHITKELMLSFPIFLPSLAEQKAIAGVLSALDNKIDLLHRQNKTLEAMAETLFRHWFLEEVDEENFKRIIKREEWVEMPLSSIATFLNGLACQKYPPFSEIHSLPVLKIRELNSGLNESSDRASKTVPKEYIINDGDLVFSWSATLMVKIWIGGQCILNQHLFKVTSESYPIWFIYFWCKEHLKEFQSIAQTHATTMGHIKRSDLDKALVLCPDRATLGNLNNQFDPIFDKLISNQIQIRHLEKLRNTLLPKLMSGEIRVKVE